MCKVIKYRFKCGHAFALQSSKNHRLFRPEGLSLCKSRAPLDIMLPKGCGPCERASNEAVLRKDITDAEKLLEHLEDTESLDVPEAEYLLWQVKQEKEQDIEKKVWDARANYPAYKTSGVERVRRGRFEKKPSPLRQEVQPDEIPDRPAVVPSTVVSSKWD